MKILLILWVVLSQSLFAQEKLSGTEYFSLFDYSVLSVREKIPAFEKRLIQHCDRVMVFLNKNPNYSQTWKKPFTPPYQLAMNLVYGAMLLMNNNNAVLYDVADKSMLMDNPLMKKATVHDEIAARYQLSQDYLDKALSVVPDDTRILAWYVSNKFRMERFERNNGTVSDEIMDLLVELTRKEPVFHLFNTLTMNSDIYFGDKREDEILELTKIMSGPNNPCGFPLFRNKEQRKCNTTNKTPFAFQGTSVYMGDVFFKNAVRKNDPSLIKEARKLYMRTSWFFFKPKFKKWKLKDNVSTRIDELNHFEKTGNLKDSNFFGTKKFLDIYTCSSCHQDGKAEKYLHIKLPN